MDGMMRQFGPVPPGSGWTRACASLLALPYLRPFVDGRTRGGEGRHAASLAIRSVSGCGRIEGSPTESKGRPTAEGGNGRRLVVLAQKQLLSVLPHSNPPPSPVRGSIHLPAGQTKVCTACIPLGYEGGKRQKVCRG